MKFGENEMNNPFMMTITDPELVQKIREGGVENLGIDDVNSLGVEVKNGNLFFGMQVSRI